MTNNNTVKPLKSEHLVTPEPVRYSDESAIERSKYTEIYSKTPITDTHE